MNRRRNLLLFTLISLIIYLPACTSGHKSNDGILMETDSAFSAMSVQDGMFKAFLHYMADDGIMLSDNSKPIEGKASLAKLFAASSDSLFTLEWRPLYEFIGAGGDLGYTWGEYRRTSKATGDFTRGNYVTIWRLQDDGTWRFVLDTGTEGLPE